MPRTLAGALTVFGMALADAYMIRRAERQDRPSAREVTERRLEAFMPSVYPRPVFSRGAVVRTVRLNVVIHSALVHDAHFNTQIAGSPLPLAAVAVSIPAPGQPIAPAQMLPRQIHLSASADAGRSALLH